MEKTAFDPKRRRLCPDGACIGVIGPDGSCRECGRSDGGAALSAVSADAHPGDHDDVQDQLHDQLHDHGDDHNQARDGGGDEVGGEVMAGGMFNPKRRLCSDGSCLGVVGPTGECPVCGTRAEA